MIVIMHSRLILKYQLPDVREKIRKKAVSLFDCLFYISPILIYFQKKINTAVCRKSSFFTYLYARLYTINSINCENTLFIIQISGS